jgi:hypothetical protein
VSTGICWILAFPSPHPSSPEQKMKMVQWGQACDRGAEREQNKPDISEQTEQG